MSTILPSAPTGTSTALPQLDTLLTPASDTAVPASIANLPAGITLVGLVQSPSSAQSGPSGEQTPGTGTPATGSSPQSSVQIATTAGTVTVTGRPAALLNDGTRVGIQVLHPADGQTAFRLIAVGDRAVAQALSSANGPATTQNLSTAAPATAGLTATLVRPAPASQPALPAGTQITVRLAAVAPPPANAGAMPAAPTLPAPTGPTATPTASPAPATGAPSLAPTSLASPPESGTDAPPPAEPADPAADTETPSPGPAGTLTGTVTAQAPGGRVLVDTALGTLSIPLADDVPVGSRLTLDIVDAPQPSPSPPPPASSSRTPTGSDEIGSQGWPAFEEAADALVQAGDKATLAQLARILPAPNDQLAASLSLFAAALRSGQTDSLLGATALAGLRQTGRTDLADRLRSSLAGLTRRAERPLGANGDWREFVIPLLIGVAIEPVRLFVRHPGSDRNSSSAAAGGSGQRFVVDITWSTLGRMQLDGLFQSTDKRFTLIVRTAHPLSTEIRNDITTLFARSCDSVGTAGGVLFHPDGRFFDPPPTDAGSAAIVV